MSEPSRATAPVGAGLTGRIALDSDDTDPLDLAVLYFDGAQAAADAVVAADLLGFGARLTAEEEQVGEDEVSFRWVVEIVSRPFTSEHSPQADLLAPVAR
jgi:hypothetical protein